MGLVPARMLDFERIGLVRDGTGGLISMNSSMNMWEHENEFGMIGKPSRATLSGGVTVYLFLLLLQFGWMDRRPKGGDWVDESQ